MLLFNDVLTGDELCSDAYEPKDIDDIVYEIDCQMQTIKDGEVNIGELISLMLSRALQTSDLANERGGYSRAWLLTTSS